MLDDDAQEAMFKLLGGGGGLNQAAELAAAAGKTLGAAGEQEQVYVLDFDGDVQVGGLRV